MNSSTLLRVGEYIHVRDLFVFSDGVHLMHLLGTNHLHRYCAKIGIKRCWFHPTRRFPHYDIPKKQRKDFFAAHPEVNKVTPRELVALYVRSR